MKLTLNCQCRHSCAILLGLHECVPRHVRHEIPETSEDLLQIMKQLPADQRQSAATEVNTADILAGTRCQGEFGDTGDTISERKTLRRRTESF